MFKILSAILMMLSAASICAANELKWSPIEAKINKIFKNGVASQSYWGNPLYGLIDKNGQWICQPKFERPVEVSGQFAVAKDAEEREGIIDLKGNWLVEPNADYDIKIYEDEPGVFVIKNKQNGLKALFACGRQLTEFLYEDIKNVDTMPGILSLEGKCGAAYVNTKTGKFVAGSEVNPGVTILTLKTFESDIPKYFDSNLDEITPDQAITTSGGITLECVTGENDRKTYALFDKNKNKRITEPKFLQSVTADCDRFNLISMKGAYCFDKDGNLICGGDGIFSTYNITPDIVLVREDLDADYKCYSISQRKYVYPESISTIYGQGFYKNWLKGKTKDGKEFIYNQDTGNIYFGDKFLTLKRDCSEGMVKSEANGKKYYFNLDKEKFIGPFDVQYLNEFQDGLCVLEETGRSRIINKDGETLVTLPANIKPNDNYSDGLLLCRIVDAETGDWSYKYLTDQFGPDIAEWYRQADEAFKQKDWEEAAILYLDVWLEDNTNEWALFNHGAACQNMGDYDEAMSAYETHMEMFPQSADHDRAQQYYNTCFNAKKEQYNVQYESQPQRSTLDKVTDTLNGLAQIFGQMGGGNSGYSGGGYSGGNYGGNSGYSSGSGGMSNSQKNAQRNSGGRDANEQRQCNNDKRTYERYDSMLSKALHGGGNASSSEISSWRSKMRSLRQKWESKGYSFPHSSNE